MAWAALALAGAVGCGGDNIDRPATGADGGSSDAPLRVDAAPGADGGGTADAAPSPDGPRDAGGPATDAGPTSGFVRIGYYPSWEAGEDAIQFQYLTHVNYAFLLPTPSGGLTGLDSTTQLDNLRALAHQHGVLVSISVGGWNDGDDSAFHTLAANATARTAFIDNLATFVTTHDLDGVDIDWEYPDPGSSANDYASLMTALATRLHGMGKLLTAAVISEGSTGEGVLDAVFDVVDLLNLMAYDGEPNSPYSLAVAALDYWLGRGLPPGKAVLGVPFYGRDPYTPYRDLVAQDPTAPQKDQIGSIYYNGIPTIQAKTELAATRGAAGMMAWELSQDTTDATSLLRAISEASP